MWSMGADQLLSKAETLKQIIVLWDTDKSLFFANIYMEPNSIQFLFYHLTMKLLSSSLNPSLVA